MSYNVDSEEELRTLIVQRPQLQQPADPLKVVVFGRDRTGKSALVNSLLGQQFAEEGVYRPLTYNVRSYGRTLDIGLSVNIFDTPSIGAFHRGTDDILDEVATKTKGSADLLVFCIDLRGRLNEGDIECMGQIAQKYGNSVWKIGMVVLTFANEFVQPQEDMTDYKEKCTEMREDIRSLLHKKVGLPFEIANSIPVLPVGRINTPILHDEENWKIRFWISALKLTQLNSRAILIAMKSNTSLGTGLTSLRGAVVAGYNRVRGVMNLKSLILAGGGLFAAMVVVVFILYRRSNNLAGTMSVSMLVDHTVALPSNPAVTEETPLGSRN